MSISPKRTVLCLLSLLLPLLLLYSLAEGASPESYPSPNERFGFGATGDVRDYDVAQLHAGWYLDWGTSEDPSRPGGMEYAQMIRLHQLTACWPQRTRDRVACPYVEPYTYTLTSPRNRGDIVSIAQVNPGSLWLIGNEMDRYDWEGGGQDEMLPELYAQAYHELYHLIKEADPTARVAIGGVIQPTPLRLEYLDMVLDEYQHRYDAMIPVDVWNIHNMILREVNWSWGAEVPPGVDAYQGRLYTIDDADNIDIFRQHILDFRQWMKEKGEQDKPLIISEYSVLYGEDYGFGPARVSNYLTETFDYLAAATDDSLGYPADDDRLVQRWAWYSLDDDGFEGFISHHHLFDPETKEITQLGTDYGAYIASHNLIRPYYDLEPVTFTLSGPDPDPLVYGQPATFTLRSRVVNWGNSSTTSFTVDLFDGDTPLDAFAIPGLEPRWEGETTVETAWSDPVTRPHTFRIAVDSGDRVEEWREDNNTATIDVDVDLAISGLRIHTSSTSSSPTVGITVTTSLSNVGHVTVRDVDFQLWDESEGELIGATAVPELVPGAGQEISFTWTLQTAGSHSILGIVDPEDAVTESDEQNNEMRDVVLVDAHQVFLPLVVRDCAR